MADSERRKKGCWLTVSHCSSRTESGWQKSEKAVHVNLKSSQAGVNGNVSPSSLMEDESCPISLLPARTAGPCKNCRASFKGGLRDDWKPAETPGRVWKDVTAQVEEPMLRSLQNRQLVLLSGETEPPKIGLTLSLPASGWNTIGHLSSLP